MKKNNWKSATKSGWALACRKWVWTCAVLAILLPSTSGTATAQELLVGNLGGNNVLSYNGNTGSFLGIFAAGGGPERCRRSSLWP